MTPCWRHAPKQTAPRWLSFGALLAGLALVAGACSSSSKPSASAPTGGTLRVGVIGKTASPNLFIGGDYSTYRQIYPRLVTRNLQTLTFQPYLATSWSASSDNQVWTFHIRPHAAWSDGQPLTASDVAFTFNTVVKYKNGPTSGFAEYLLDLTNATATNPTTVVLHFSQPLPTALALAGHMYVLPEHVWAPYATGDGAGLKTFPNLPTPGHPVVSGAPWMLTTYTTNAVALFARNPHYFEKAPLLDGFGVQFFASPDAAVTALKSGNIDVLQGVPPTTVATLSPAAFHTASVPSIDDHGLAINPNPAKPDHTELLQPDVRMAFEYGVDRNAIAQQVFLGHAKPGSTIIPPANGSFHNTLSALPFDLSKANQLLDQAGYPKGPDGVRVAQGHPMAYQVLLQPTDQREFQILQGDFAKMGVTLTATALDAKAESAAITAPDKKYLNYDMALVTGTSGGYDPDFGLSTFTCFERGVLNTTGYCDPAYDKLYFQQKTAAPADRVKIIDQMQQMVYDSRAFVTVTYNDELVTWSNKWTGFTMTPRGIFGTLSETPLTSVHRSS